MPSSKISDSAVLGYFSIPSAASDAVLGLLESSSNNGREIRRKWLRILAKEFNATHVLCDCVSWDPQQETLVFHDSCFAAGNSDWRKLENWADGLRLETSGFDVEHCGEWMRGSVISKADQPEFIIDALWTPFRLHSGLTLSVMHQGLYAGGISLFRDETVAAPFEGTEMSIDGRAWEVATCHLPKATFPMLNLNNVTSSTFLFEEDGELALANDTAEDAKSVSSLVESFAKSGEPNIIHCTDTRSVHLSWLRGHSRSLILALCTPLASVQVSDFGKLTYLQRKISTLAANGASNSEIAIIVERTSSTVKSHLETVYSVLGLENRAELARAYHSGMQWRP